MDLTLLSISIKVFEFSVSLSLPLSLSLNRPKVAARVLVMMGLDFESAHLPCANHRGCLYTLYWHECLLVVLA